MASDNLAHIVMFPFPAHGHINPMVRLGSLLAHHFGFAITFITTHKHQSVLPSCWPRGGGIKPSVIRCVAISDMDTPQGSQGSGGMALMWNIIAFTDSIGHIVEATLWNMRQNEGIEITCIISDPFVPWVEEISNNLGVQWCILWAASCASNLVNNELPRLLEEAILPVTDSTNASSTFIEISPGVLPMSLADIPFSIQFHDPSDPGFASRVRRFSYLKKASWVFVNAIDVLEQREISAMKHVYNNFAAVGLLLPLEHMGIRVQDTKERVDCLEWLGTQKSSSVLYVSFGTMATLTENQFEQFAEGLLASGQPFLWVVRPDLVLDMSNTYLESYTARIQGLGFIVPWAPQLEVLSHPSIGGFLSHCGWNSVIESISMGVPLICWPCFAEQNLNAKYVVENWKVGLKLWSGTKSLIVKEKVVEIVQTLMVGEEGRILRNRVRNLGSLCKQAWMEGGPSYTNLEMFSRSIIRMP